MVVDASAELLHDSVAPESRGDIRPGTEGEFSSPNVEKLNKFLTDFDIAAKEPDELVNLEEFEKAAGVFERSWADFVSSDGALDVAKIEEFSSGTAQRKYDLLNSYSHGGQEVSLDSLTSDIIDLSALVRMKKFIGYFAEDQLDRFEQSQLLRHFDEDLEKAELVCLQQMVNLSGEYYTEDVLAETKVPYASDPRGEDSRSLFAGFKVLALANPEPDLEEAYQKLQKGILSRANGRVYLQSIHVGDESEKRQAGYKFNDRFNWQEWEKLDFTDEQKRLLYDLTHEEVMSVLFRGGHESWDGTSAAALFANLRDPRAIPGLVRHLRLTGSGHTNNIVSGAISEILKEANSLEEKDRVISSMEGIEKDVVLKWYLKPDSLFHKLDGYGKAYAVFKAEEYFANEALCNLAQQIAKGKGIELDQDALFHFFTGWDSDNLEQILVENARDVADLVAQGNFVNLRSALPKLFHNLVNPPDGDFLHFPRAVATQGLHISDESLTKLEGLYQTRELRTGIMDRNSMADGLLFLSNKEGGRGIFENLFSLTTGARSDTKRMRNAFDLMRNLEHFGGFEFPEKSSLVEIVDDLREQLVVRMQEMMELDQEDLPYLREGMEKFAQTGLLEIIPTLLAQSRSSHIDVHKVVKQIGQHIIRGDFREWRNGLETAQAQLSVLDEDKRSVWTDQAQELSVDVNLQSGTERLKAAVDAIKRIGEEARAHVLDIYKIEFSFDRFMQLERTQQELVASLKSNDISHEEKRELGIRKRSIDAEARIVQGFLGIENLKSDGASMKNLPEIIAKMKSAMATLDGLDQPMSDLDQIEHVLTTEKDLATVSTLRAYDSDDPMALLNIGVEPRETCQSWRHGSFNYCLPAYVVDANKRVLNVENERGEVLARSVIKLTSIKTEDGEMPAILMEPIYSNSEMAQIKQAIVRLALLKAKSIGAAVVMASDINVVTGADNMRSVPVLETEAKKQGMNVRRENIEVFLPRSYNAAEYSDSLGGVQSWFDRYRTTSAMVATS